MTSINIEKITPYIGVKISGVDLSSDLNLNDLNHIYELLIKHKVIFFHNQIISSNSHLNFAKSFGAIEPPHPVYPSVKDFPDIVMLENGKNNPPDTDVWHTDLTFKANPPFASILYSKVVPSFGGDTLWSSLTEIYDSLPIHIQNYLLELYAVHDMGDFRNTFTLNEKIGNATELNEAFVKFGNSIHPVIKEHPISKKKLLYINPSFTSHIVGLNSSDSRNLLNYLFNFMNKPEFQLRFKWEKNVIAMWDNRSTMHYAVGDYMPHHRLMHRVTIINDKRNI